MKERLQRFRALDGEARGLFVRAALLLPLISLSLRIRGFGLTQAMLLRFLPHSSPTFAGAARDLDPSIADEKQLLTVRMVRAAARYRPRKATCLEESLVSWFLLRRRGVACEVRIGARKVAGQFEAHAWVECGGQALNETGEESRRYAAFEPVRSCLTESQ